ncbi:MAG: hypothetical protein V5A20_05750 [Salinibacter sp.]|uniref:tetratricopeptide repeat protein n=1 Tax=Salinibacter sp. TaxID=2065818 RepID=UPI002FC2FBBF
MNDVEEHILSYPHLTQERQREVEAYVERHPEWAPLLRDVRSVEGLSANVRADPPSDPLLATYVMVRHLGNEGELSAQLQAAFARLEARIEEKEALRREVEAAQRRLTEAEAAIDPASHFETLTEHEIGVENREEVEEEAAAGSGAESSPNTGSFWGDALWPLPRLARRGMAIAGILVGVYGGLYGVSLATQSPLDRLAATDVSDQVVDNYATARMRSTAPKASSSVDEQYMQALSVLESARVSTLGLFPRYSADRLAQAEKHLGEVLEQTESGSFLALEAHFYLGKIALAQRDVGAARSHFKTVVQREGRQTQEAYEILKTLQQEYSGPGS